MHDQQRRKAEFGDFQTPISLAREVCSLVLETGFQPASVLEPTCGRGSFIQAAMEAFPCASQVLGFEVNYEYVEQARMTAAQLPSNAFVDIRQSDFFLTDWSKIIDVLPEPILIIGNPPWVTNTKLSTLGSNNVPVKTNIDKLRGIDALTGRSNFDISEWMLRKNLEWLKGRTGMLAMLCKTTTARKVLFYAWRIASKVVSASVYKLDAGQHFGASVDACLLLVRTEPIGGVKEGWEYDTLHSVQPTRAFGLRDGMLVADIKAYENWRHLAGTGLSGWRSGIKHDCSKVFEIRRHNDKFINGLGELVDFEPAFVFPLLKSSDLAAHRKPHRWMVVPQRTMGEDPSHLRASAPKTWDFLLAHADLLDKRKSSIYKNRPRFSIFGVGSYSFAPWKVAISGLYKKLDFIKVSPFQNRPVVLDDTCYLFPCRSENECVILHELVTSEFAKEFWSAFIFWDAKRPITAQILNMLDLAALVRSLGKESDITRRLAERQLVQYTEGIYQQLLFREDIATYES
jgi:hypothetical protein